MLPKKLRMDKTSAKEVFMRPESTYSSPHFLLKMAHTTATQSHIPSRFSVSVSKKVANTAVLRNRTRRRVYGALRGLLSGVKPGFFVGFAVKNGGEKASLEDVVSEVRDLLKRARLFTQE